MKQFDEIFSEKAREAFGNYNADHLADEGWKSFVAASKGKRRLGGIIPLWAKAATVALLAGTATFIAYQAMRMPQVTETLSSNDISAEQITRNPNRAEGELTTEGSKPVPRTEPGSPGELTTEGSKPVTRNPQPVPRNPQPATRTEPGSPGELTTEGSNPATRTPEPVSRTPQPVTILSPSDSLNIIAEAALREFLEAQAEEVAIADEGRRKGKTSVMAGVAGLLAQSGEGRTPSPGMTLGIYLERRLSSRISFRPGLTLAVNNLNLQSNTMVSADKFSYDVPLYDGNSGTLDYYNGKLNTLAMEIPLNIVFTIFDRDRKGLYLTTGASTVVYLSQSFDADFVNAYTQQEYNTTTGEMVNETRYSTVEVNNDYGAFSRTDLMGLASFSAGYSLPYGRTGTLLIEPFIQLPLADLTSLNLKVRYGGVSMKLRFGGNTPSK